MVQRREPDKACPRAETKKSHPKQERNRFSQNQEIRDKGSDPKKKPKKARSIERMAESENLEAHLGHQHVQSPEPSSKSRWLPPKLPLIKGTLPNYMKPTTSSGTRNESRSKKVNSHNPPSDDNDNINTSRNKGNSSLSSLGKKPTEIFTRKKNSGTLLFPDASSSAATCSSTLKDSKFPKELELSPGSEGSEGTSTIKVCPFTYCSLNGHWHRPLPPLRSFVSARRRRMLKTQKSIKLKALSSCRRRCSRKNGKRVEVTEDWNDDFFVEIYAEPREDFEQSAVDRRNHEDEEEDVGSDEMNSDAFSELLLNCRDQEGAETEPFTSSLDECCHCSYSEISYDDGLDQTDKLVDLEVRVLAGFLDYIEKQEDQVGKEQHDKWGGEGCCPATDSRSVGEDMSDSDAYEAFLEAIDVSWGEEMPGCTDDGTSGSMDIRRQNIYDDDLELDFLGEEPYGTGFPDQNSHRNGPLESTGSCSMDGEIFFGVDFVGLDEERSTGEGEEGADVNVGKETTEEENKPHEGFSLEEMEFLEQFLSEADRESGVDEAESPETKELVCEVTNSDAPDAPGEERGNHIAATEESSSPGVVEQAGSHPGEPDRGSDLTSPGKDCLREEATKEQHPSLHDINRSPPANHEDGITRARLINITRRNLGDGQHPDEELTGRLNPRSPNLLPEEPDPEAEKVDLRHQEMDERKNTEEWMVDRALREFVGKLAPSRKKKVALIVEAIETIVPTPHQHLLSPHKHVHGVETDAKAMQAFS